MADSDIDKLAAIQAYDLAQKYPDDSVAVTDFLDAFGLALSVQDTQVATPAWSDDPAERQRNEEAMRAELLRRKLLVASQLPADPRKLNAYERKKAAVTVRPWLDCFPLMRHEYRTAAVADWNEARRACGWITLPAICSECERVVYNFKSIGTAWMHDHCSSAERSRRYREKKAKLKSTRPARFALDFAAATKACAQRQEAIEKCSPSKLCKAHEGLWDQYEKEHRQPEGDAQDRKDYRRGALEHALRQRDKSR